MKIEDLTNTELVEYFQMGEIVLSHYENLTRNKFMADYDRPNHMQNVAKVNDSSFLRRKIREEIEKRFFGLK